MDAEFWGRVREAFTSATELQGEARAAFLTSLPAELRAEAEGLLAAHDGAGSFLERRGTQLALGAKLDRYEILELVGRGGMGEVYRAARRDGTNQEVAIKVLGLAFPLAEAERQFLREGRALARLSHPQIVRMLDSGRCAAGQYLVMEWVDGTSVDVWSRGVPLGERLRLFEEICRAVHAAHQSLIVHRDLKPSNILVTGDGQPKLLDFGIAQMADLPGQLPAVTRTALRVMTLAYCSPEQARDLPAGIPSDVYSLGLVLYEMLTGRRGQEVTGLPLDEALARITQGELQRDASVPRELDAVIRKATAKEPERRYASALELAGDIERYRAGYPVRAQPPTFGYLAGKWVRRNRTTVVWAGVAMLAAVAALLAFALEYQRSRRERELAERRFEVARQMAQVLLFDAPAKMAPVPGTIDTRKWMAERALAYLERLAEDVRGDPGLALNLARGYRQVALQQFNLNTPHLNDPRGALRSLERGEAILAALPKPGPEVWEELLLNRLERPYQVLGIARDLGSNEDRLAELSTRIPESREKADLLARVWFRLAVNVDRPEAGRLELWSKLERYYAVRLQEKPEDLERIRNLALVYKNVSGVHAFGKRWQQAIEASRRALELDEARLRRRPDDAGIRMDISFDLGRLGQDLCEEGQREEGLAHLRRAVMMRRQLVTEDPEDRRAPDRLAWMLGETGRQLLQSGAAAEGEKLIREAVAIRRKGWPGAGENSLPHLRAALAERAEQKGQAAVACAEWAAAGQALPADTASVIWKHVQVEVIRERAGRCR